MDLLYERERINEFGGMLDSMSLLSDGYPVDPAIVPDWKRAVSSITIDHEALSALEGFDAMIKFIATDNDRAPDPEVTDVLRRMRESEADSSKESGLWILWQTAIDDVQNDRVDAGLRLHK